MLLENKMCRFALRPAVSSRITRKRAACVPELSPRRLSPVAIRNNQRPDDRLYYLHCIRRRYAIFRTTFTATSAGSLNTLWEKEEISRNFIVDARRRNPNPQIRFWQFVLQIRCTYGRNKIERVLVGVHSPILRLQQTFRVYPSDVVDREPFYPGYTISEDEFMTFLNIGFPSSPPPTANTGMCVFFFLFLLLLFCVKTRKECFNAFFFSLYVTHVLCKKNKKKTLNYNY